MMRWYENKLLLAAPWLVVIAFTAYATTADYYRFQQDKSDQAITLKQALAGLARVADEWTEQVRQLHEHYRQVEERAGMEQAIQRLKASAAAAATPLRGLPSAHFFPETERHLASTALSLDRLADVADSTLEVKSELIELETRLAQTPARIQFHRQRTVYFRSVNDLLRYYLAQEAQAQSESLQLQLLERKAELEQQLEHLAEAAHSAKAEVREELAQAQKALDSEFDTDYASLLQARWRETWRHGFR